jgi:nucleotide-binding universal stress UspA family protein
MRRTAASENSSSPRGVVVGVDGSPGSAAALCWALKEAQRRAVALRAVTAWEFPLESTFGSMTAAGDFHPVVAAEEILAKALAEAGVPPADEAVTTAAVEGHPAEVLLQVSTRAQLLVVGSRGHGKFLGALLGSVSRYVAAHAACPVVVIGSGGAVDHRTHLGTSQRRTDTRSTDDTRSNASDVSCGDT